MINLEKGGAFVNVFKREMIAHRKSFVIWCFGFIAMVVLGMWKYGEIASSNAALHEMNELMAAMPKALQVLIGTGSLDLATIQGYYGVIYLYIGMMAAIHAVTLGATIIVKEERDKTAEFLFSKPAARNKVVAIKLIVSFVHLLMINVITMIASLVAVEYYGNDQSMTKEIMLLMIGLFLFQLIFLTLGGAIAAVNKNVKSTLSIGTAAMLFTFILSMVIEMNEKLDWLKYATPFKYFEAKHVIVEGTLEPIFIILSIGLIICLTIISVVFYQKRDLHI